MSRTSSIISLAAAAAIMAASQAIGAAPSSTPTERWVHTWSRLFTG